jgi:hypothetical protein
MPSYRSRSDGSHYPVSGRSLYDHPSRSGTYSREIHYGNQTEARESVTFANMRWDELQGRRKDRVHLLQAMNEARNRSLVESRNQRISPEERRRAAEAHKVLTAWVESHKGKE